MPTHHAKFTIAKPHPTGSVMPQMPVPFQNSHPNAISRTLTMPNAIRTPPIQPNGVRPVSTVRMIFSVTEANVCPGAITGGSMRYGRCDGGRSVRPLVAINYDSAPGEPSTDTGVAAAGTG